MHGLLPVSIVPGISHEVHMRIPLHSLLLHVILLTCLSSEQRLSVTMRYALLLSLTCPGTWLHFDTALAVQQARHSNRAAGMW
jgi:hypothetical protein